MMPGQKGLEVERKFRITEIERELLVAGQRIIQGYLNLSPEVRVRIRDHEAYLTVKGEGALLREECECPIPVPLARKILNIAEGSLIQKVRYVRDRWEIDFYEGHLEGLVVAEFEMKSEEESVTLPAWMRGHEVTYDLRYKNKRLVFVNSLEELEQ